MKTYNIPSLNDLPRPEREREALVVSPFLSFQIEDFVIFKSANVKNRKLIARSAAYFTVIYMIQFFNF